MKLRWIAAAMAATLLCGPAVAQESDDRERPERRQPRQEQGDRRPASGAERRERIDRAEQRIRERSDRAAPSRRQGSDDIYRRGNNYRRW